MQEVNVEQNELVATAVSNDIALGFQDLFVSEAPVKVLLYEVSGYVRKGGITAGTSLNSLCIKVK
jgi:hypothetical protein